MLGRTLVARTLRLAGLAVALVGADALAPAPAAALPAAHASTAAAKRKTGKASKAAKRTSAKASRKRSNTSGKSGRRAAHAGRHAARTATRGRAHHASPPREEPADQWDETPTAELAAIAVPQVDMPELALKANDRALDTFADAPARTRNPFVLISRSASSITRSASSLLDGLVARARGQLGTRYVLGGANPGDALDCSSFARYVMEALNIRLPRTANQQARVGRPVPRDPSQLRPGDLLTFGSGSHTSHVGIYLGEGRFIHASVKSGQVIETTIERNRSLFRKWQGARRLMASADDSVGTGGEDPSSGG